MALDASDFENVSLNLDDTATEKKDATGGISADETSVSLLAGHVETKRLRYLRFVFLFIFVATAVLVSSGMFYVIRRSERNDFDTTFIDQAEKVLDTVQLTVAQKLAVIEAASMTFTSYAVLKNDVWPFVTQPDFSIRAASARSLGEVLSLELYPIVTSDKLAKWKAYAQQNSAGWMQAGLAFDAEDTKHNEEHQRALQTTTNQDTSISSFVYSVNESGVKVPSADSAVFFPFWQSSPVNPGLVNYDLQSDERWTEDLRAVQISHHAVLTDMTYPEDTDEADVKALYQYWLASSENLDVGSIEPVSRIFFPVFDRLQVSGAPQVVAILAASFHWGSFLRDLLPPDSTPVVVVLENSCGQVHTYEINGEDVVYGGKGDLHDRRYDDSKMVSDRIFERLGEVSFTAEKFQFVALEDRCSHKLYVYPTNAMEDEFISPAPWWFVGIIASVFVLASILIFFYHWFVERRQKLVMRQAKQASNIVASIFPAAVRLRLFEGETNGPLPALLDSQKQRIKTFLEPGENDTATGTNGEPNDEDNDKPMADLFPAVTIMFADITGFAAWSSQREPSEVFTLLQTLYHAFDKHARNLSVFKVETIGDCYVAAAGLPSPQPDHAVRMARFASKCMMSMNELTRGLEVQLGPDTGELRLKVGLHSGAVTAGVLKGTKGRFQLFGDTMNMAARMESNSLDNRIQCSPATEVLIRQAGKGHWLTARDTLVAAKGKGEIQCYWVTPRSDATSIVRGENSFPEDVGSDRIIEDDLHRIFGGDNPVLEISSPHDRYQRLIDWNVELLLGSLKQIAAKRRDMKQPKKAKKAEAPVIKLQSGRSAVDEVTEVITLPQMAATIDKSKVTQPSWMIMNDNVISQLRDYVTTIASMYRNNAFHNFAHASHVTQSVSKLLKRVVVRDAAATDQANAQELHDYTFGITSDPVTQFALVFCALVHDVDHHGVSNFQLISEGSPLARLYKNKSIAEQNSVDVAWDLLMDPTYEDLQKAIYSDESEMKRFRQLVVNIVLATDIFDKDMTMIRDRRWGRAFQYDEDPKSEEPLPVVDEVTENPLARIEGANLKATIVMEHMIQASDVAHTMQHWDIYQKWNERLFTEMHDAFEAGRSTKDPSLSWYEGEIMFFDKYIIPLAKKLADCGVFGVSSDECLNYALQNRKVWAIKGDEIVTEFKARALQRKKKAGRSASIVGA